MIMIPSNQNTISRPAMVRISLKTSRIDLNGRAMVLDPRMYRTDPNDQAMDPIGLKIYHTDQKDHQVMDLISLTMYHTDQATGLVVFKIHRVDQATELIGLKIHHIDQATELIGPKIHHINQEDLITVLTNQILTMLCSSKINIDHALKDQSLNLTDPTLTNLVVLMMIFQIFTDRNRLNPKFLDRKLPSTFTSSDPIENLFRINVLKWTAGTGLHRIIQQNLRMDKMILGILIGQ